MDGTCIAAQKADRAGFAAERQVLNQARHPNIVTLIGCAKPCFVRSQTRVDFTSHSHAHTFMRTLPLLSLFYTLYYSCLCSTHSFTLFVTRKFSSKLPLILPLVVVAVVEVAAGGGVVVVVVVAVVALAAVAAF